MTINQLSVFVENKPGRLSEITAILQQHQVDIRALSIADTTSFGVLRLIVDKPDLAQSALCQAGFTVNLTPVIAIGIQDHPGGLAQALCLLRDGGVSVEYMYAFISRRQATAYVIFRVDDSDKALSLMAQGGFSALSEEDISH